MLLIEVDYTKHTEDGYEVKVGKQQRTNSQKKRYR